MSAPAPSTPRAKSCSCCGERKPVAAFGKNIQAKDGLHYYCKACAAEKQREWARNHTETVKRMRADYLTRVRAANAERNPYE